MRLWVLPGLPSGYEYEGEHARQCRQLPPRTPVLTPSERGIPSHATLCRRDHLQNHLQNGSVEPAVRSEHPTRGFEVRRVACHLVALASLASANLPSRERSASRDDVLCRSVD